MNKSTEELSDGISTILLSYDRGVKNFCFEVSNEHPSITDHKLQVLKLLKDMGYMRLIEAPDGGYMATEEIDIE